MTAAARYAALMVPTTASALSTPEVLPGPKLLLPANSAAYDEKIVAALSKHSAHEICAQRIFLESKAIDTVKPLIVELLRMPTLSRMNLVQAVASLAAHIPEGPVVNWPEVGNVDELRMAATRGRAAGVMELTRYELLPQLIEDLGVGTSGRSVYAEVFAKPNEGSWLRVCYGMADRRDDVPVAKMEWALNDFSFVDLVAQKPFFDALREDGHEFVCNFVSPILDYFAALFCAAFTGGWDGVLKRMKFTTRPRVTKMGYAFDRKTYELLSPDHSPFKAVLQAMQAHFQMIEVPEAPKSQLSWIIQNIPESVRASKEQFHDLFVSLSKDWLRMKDSIQLLEASMIAHLVSLRYPQGRAPPVMGFMPCGFSAGLQQICEARQYRGKEDGEGVAAFLNQNAKQVGIDPLGPLATVYEDIRRYEDVFAKIKQMGYKSVSIYTHRGAADAMALGAKVGLEVKVYAAMKNQAGQPRDFYYDGLALDDKCEFRIIDVIPDVKSASGQNPTVVEWNAAYGVVSKILDAGVPRFVMFSRLPAVKVGQDTYQYEIDAALMQRDFRRIGNVSFSFAGCRPHNGEFLLWGSGSQPRPALGLEWISVESDAMASMCVGLISRVVPPRMVLANNLRTWAVPCGVITFSTGVRTFHEMGPDGQPVASEDVDPVSASANLLALRLDPAIRSVHAETRVKSTAATFGEDKTVGLDAEEAFMAMLREKRAAKK